MALTDKLTAIANAIRTKSGKTSTLTLDEMPVEIEALTSKEQLKAGEYPDYVRPEVLELANKVNSVKNDNSIIFLAMSDSHYFADQVLNFYEAETNASAVQANQAAKALAYLLDIDFFAHLGDVSCGAASTTPEMLKTQIEGFVSYFREAKSDLPVFVCIGNHDTGIYYNDAQTDGAVHTLTGEYLYNNFTAYSESEDTVFGDKTYGGYCYRDFADKKLRVIMLNTSEKLVNVQTDQATYGVQRVWLANALLDLNTKTDATEWGFIIFSHYPADYGATMPLSELLKAYVEGTSFTITDPISDYYVGDGTSQAVDFTGKNGAKFIAQFHGHIHNFLTSKLYSYATGSGVQYDAHRVCVPNGQFNRENTYTTVGSKTDISFADDKAYNKTANTADGTSFVVNVINPSEQMIYSFCYGAGYDRTIGYASTVYYNISTTLKNVTNSNSALSVEEGESYTTSITAAEGYELKTVTVTMGGVDITSTSYANGVVNIASVTGNIVITATAAEIVNYTNYLPISTDTDGSIYNGVGYKADTYLSAGTAGSRSGVYTSGFIPCKAGDTLYFEACTMPDENTNCRFTYYDDTKTYITNCHWTTANDEDTSRHIVLTFGSDGNIASMHIPEDSSYGQKVGYIRFCCLYLGADSIVTVNETIE